MNKAIKYFLIAVSAVLALLVGACSDDLHLFNDLGSEIYEQGSMRVSRFKLTRETVDIPQGHTDITIHLLSHTDGSTMELDATVEHSADHQWISIYIPKDKSIPDSDYDLTITLSDGSRLGTKLTVTFRSEMLHQVAGIHKLYKLEGKGSVDDPYLIATTDDFFAFQLDLAEDPTLGAGLTFMQTADIVAPAASDAINGRLYAPTDFAGTYDGHNHAITVQYSGAGNAKDNYVGIFATLANGAVVKNLVINASIRGANSFCGAVAGQASDAVDLYNVTVKGYVVGQDHVGGFIGVVNGSLSAKACCLAVSVSGTDKVGGLVGAVENGSLTVDGLSNLLSTPSENGTDGDQIRMHDFTVIANNDHAGGVAGYLNGSCTISGVYLQHTIDGETADIKVIYAGNNCAGGLVGEALITAPSKAISTHSLAPVTVAKAYGGGLFGKVKLSAELSLQSSTIGTQILGGNYVGGFIGHATTGGNLVIATAASGSTNFIGQVRGGAALVKGRSDVGGVFGYIEGDMKCQAVTTVNVNVSASDSDAGGVIGYQHINTLECKDFNLAADMTVQGNYNVGGYVGYANYATIRGTLNNNQSINAKSHPASTSFTTSTFTGKVEGYSTASAGKAMGGIVGYGYDVELSALRVTGSVSGSEKVGGIVGHLKNATRGYIWDCVAQLELLDNLSGDYTGGIAGLFEFGKSKQSDLINYTEKVNGQNYTGGIFGAILLLDDCNSFNLSNIFNEGEIYGTCQVGGCVGYIEHSTADNFRGHDVAVHYAGNFADVEASADGNVGGIIGHGNTARMIVLYSANHGNVHSKGISKVGGIIGCIGHDAEGATFYLGENMELAYCCNRGKISSDKPDSNLGGIVGYQEEGNEFDEQKWMTHDCYNAGNISSDQSADNGGIIGFIDHYGEIGQCINFGKVDSGNGGVGTHPSSGIFYHHDVYILDTSGKDWCAETFSYDDRTKQSTFSGFDFSNIWLLNDSKNDSYPSLRNCPFQYR